MKILIAIFTIFILVSGAFALDTGVDTHKQRKQEREKTQTLKKTREEREQEGRKKSETVSKATERQDSDILKSIEDDLRKAEAEMTVSADVLFLSEIAKLEATTEPFLKCRILSDPKLPGDFGLTSEIRPGVFDVIKGNYLSQAAQSNAFIGGIADEQAILDYRNCIAFYGAVIAQAHINLARAVKKNSPQTQTIDHDEFVSRAKEALAEAIGKVTDEGLIERYQRIVNDSSPCRFDRSVENIRCGASLLTLGTVPKLTHEAVTIYPGHYFGYSTTFKVAKSQSYQSAIEKLKTTTKYSKWATEVEKFAEQLESEGRMKEAAMVRKKAWEIAKAGKQGISPNKLLPTP